MAIRLAFTALLLCYPDVSEAAEPLAGRAKPLVTRDTPWEGSTGPSLFSAPEAGGLFAALPKRKRLVMPRIGTSREEVFAESIRNLIARAEAGPDGYDAVQYGASVRPSSRPTRMTLEQIYAWIAETPGQPHAIGRYQFIPATLRRLVDHLAVRPDALFSPMLQDRMANVLIDEAGFTEFLAGNMGRKTFMNRLARVWAGLPTSSGKSHYHGYAGNKATMSWTQFEREMARAMPD